MTVFLGIESLLSLASPVSGTPCLSRCFRTLSTYHCSSGGSAIICVDLIDHVFTFFFPLFDFSFKFYYVFSNILKFFHLTFLFILLFFFSLFLPSSGVGHENGHGIVHPVPHEHKKKKKKKKNRK